MSQYTKLRTIISKHRQFKEFSARLSRSPIKNNPYYLGLLLFDLIIFNQDDFALHFNLLLKHGVDPNFHEPLEFFEKCDASRSVLMIACQKSSKKIVECLVECAEVDWEDTDSKGRNAIFYGIKNKNEENGYEILNFLISHQSNLIKNQRQENKNLLLFAIKSKSFKIIQLLLEHHMDLNLQFQTTGNTPFHVFIESYKHLEKQFFYKVLKLFIEKGVNPFIKNAKNQNCFESASKYKIDLSQYFPFHSQISNKENISQYSLNPKTIEKYQPSSDSEEEENPPDFHFDEKFSMQIYQFSQKKENLYAEAWKDLQNLYYGIFSEFKEMFALELSIVGSFASGLWTPTSDINIAYLNMDNKNQLNIDSILEKMLKIMKSKSKELQIQKIFIKRGQKFPKLKIQLLINKQLRKLDISIFHKNLPNSKYVCFICDEIQKYACLKPFFFILHEIICHFKINSHQKGGIQNYLLFLLTLFALTQLESENYDNVGVLFQKVVEKLAFGIQYEYEIENEELKKVLQMRDPLNPMNNVGTSQTNAEKVEQVFKAIYYGLNVYKEENVIGYLCGLGKIFC